VTENSTLWQLLKDAGITLEDVAQQTGHSLGYLVNVVQGRAPLSDALKFRIARAFPDTAEYLLQEPEAT